MKDLGVTLSSNGNFKEHINNVLSTANQLWGWVLRTFNMRKTLPMMTLWKTLIRSRLDYCCQLWWPSKKDDIQALEQLQRQYIRKISGVQHLTYWQPLKYLSLNSLERRRDSYIIMYVWRIQCLIQDKISTSPPCAVESRRTGVTKRDRRAARSSNWAISFLNNIVITTNNYIYLLKSNSIILQVIVHNKNNSEN